MRLSLSSNHMKLIQPNNRPFRYWFNLSLFFLASMSAAILAMLTHLAYTQAMDFTHPGRRPIIQTPAEYGMPEWRATEFQTSDGLALRGWFIPPAADKEGAAIILVHGQGGTREEMLTSAQILAQDGFGVLIFDFRNHGESDGTVSSLGYLESIDIQAAAQHLATFPEVNPAKIGILGRSMGAAATVIASAQIPEIKAVVIESAFTSLQDNLEHSLFALTGYPPILYPRLVVWFAERETQLPFDKANPVEEIGKISPRPILIIHGALDPLIPVENAYALYEAAGLPKELWIINNAYHSGFLDPDPEGYPIKIVTFFNSALFPP